jgi:hypothetical protein
VYIPKNTYTAKVEALTNVYYGDGVLDRIDAIGNLYAADSSTVNAGEIGGALTSSRNGSANVSIVENKRVDITAVKALVPGENALDTTDFDQQSNYAFKFDINGNRKVTVRNVSGLDPGQEYFVGKNNSGAEQRRGDWVCLALDSYGSANPVCTVPIKKICRTNGEGSCFADSAAATSEARAQWKLKAKTEVGIVGMAPGILWFDGDLILDGGTFYNSLLATGNIKVTSSIKVVAPNYAGYSGYRDSAPVGICNSTFDSAGDATNTNTLIPTQLCNTTKLTYDASAASGLGNYALMAGSQTTKSGVATYVGGNITTGSTSNIFGNVHAGNELQTSSSTTISGSISALGLGVATANRNRLSGSTTINLMGLPTTLSTNDTCTVCKQESRGSTRIKWTKYL